MTFTYLGSLVPVQLGPLTSPLKRLLAAVVTLVTSDSLPSAAEAVEADLRLHHAGQIQGAVLLDMYGTLTDDLSGRNCK